MVEEWEANYSSSISPLIFIFFFFSPIIQTTYLSNYVRNVGFISFLVCLSWNLKSKHYYQLILRHRIFSFLSFFCTILLLFFFSFFFYFRCFFFLSFSTHHYQFPFLPFFLSSISFFLAFLSFQELFIFLLFLLLVGFTIRWLYPQLRDKTTFSPHPLKRRVFGMTLTTPVLGVWEV